MATVSKKKKSGAGKVSFLCNVQNDCDLWCFRFELRITDIRNQKQEKHNLSNEWDEIRDEVLDCLLH